jgi:hypothetical protein
MRYFLGFLVAIGLIVMVFILLIHGFSGGDKPKTPQTSLLDYANTDTVMQYTVDGPLTSDEQHQGLRISVGQDQDSIEIYQGYQNNVIKSKTYPNNSSSYAQFLRALQLLNYTKGNKDPNKTDERGFCPDGNRYIFEIINNSSDIQRYWATSCGGQGNFGGDSAKVRALFRQQIPDYDDLTSDTNVE